MNDKNKIRGSIVTKAFSDVHIYFNKSIFPHLKKSDHQLIENLYASIQASVKVNIDLNYPNTNIKEIGPGNILDTYLKREHGIKLTKEEFEKIVKKPINREEEKTTQNLEANKENEFEKKLKSYDDKYRFAATIIFVGSIILAYIAIPFSEDSAFLAVVFFIVCQGVAYYIYKQNIPRKDERQKNITNPP